MKLLGVKNGLLIAVVAIVVLTGLYVVTIQRNASKISDISTNGASATPEKKFSSKAHATRGVKVHTAQGSLAIPEWGVTLPVSGDIADANYIFATGFPIGIYLSTDTIDAASACEKDPNIETALIRYRLNEKVENLVGEMDGTVSAIIASQKAPMQFMKIGNYVYGLSFGNGVKCNDGIRAANYAFVQALPSLEKVTNSQH